MTGPEFANAHGDDASTWTAADIETEQNLDAIDAHTRRQYQQHMRDAGERIYASLTGTNPVDIEAAILQARFNATPAA